MTPDRRAALVALKDAVEAGNATRTTIEEMAAGVFGLNTNAMDVGAAYAQGSTDAALALLGAVLPRAWCVLRISTLSRAIIGCVDADAEVVAQASTPARALLLAILTAMIEQEAQP